MGACNDPGGLRAVDSGKIGLHPLVLLISCVVESVVSPALNVSKWTCIIRESFSGNRSSIPAVGVGKEVGLGTVDVVGFTIKGDEVSLPPS